MHSTEWLSMLSLKRWCNWKLKIHHIRFDLPSFLHLWKIGQSQLPTNGGAVHPLGALAHEATLAARALCILKEHAHSSSRMDMLILSEKFLGRTTHDVLAPEADLYTRLFSTDSRLNYKPRM